VSTTHHGQALGAAAALCLVLWSASAWAEARRPLSRQVVEASVLIGFGQGLGRTPLVSPGAGIEFGVARWLGIAAGGHAMVALAGSAGYFDETTAGGGWDAAARVYVRGGWPRGFGVGAAMGLSAVPGVAIATPRAELFYRFVLRGHLALRITGAIGGVILWDTAPDDATPGPAPLGPAAVDASDSDTFSHRGFLIGLGASVGWAGPSPARGPARRRR